MKDERGKPAKTLLYFKPPCLYYCHMWSSHWKKVGVWKRAPQHMRSLCHSCWLKYSFLKIFVCKIFGDLKVFKNKNLLIMVLLWFMNNKIVFVVNSLYYINFLLPNRDAFGVDHSPFVLTDVYCQSSYLTILQCSYQSTIGNDCFDDYDELTITCCECVWVMDGWVKVCFVMSFYSYH